MTAVRRGFYLGIPTQAPQFLQDRALTVFHPLLYQNWSPHGSLPMAWNLHESDFAARFRDSSGHLWLVLNEPDNPAQANLSPAVAVQLLWRWRAAFGPLGWAAPGTLIGPEGFAWLDKFIAAKGPIPEYWSFHIYSHDEPHLLDQWDQVRAWMARHNVERPVILSECASWSDDPAMQIAVMDAIVDLMKWDELLHCAVWFSSHYGSVDGWWARSDLLDIAGRLTPVGEHFVKVSGPLRDLAAGGTESTIFLPVVAVG